MPKEKVTEFKTKNKLFDTNYENYDINWKKFKFISLKNNQFKIESDQFNSSWYQIFWDSIQIATIQKELYLSSFDQYRIKDISLPFWIKLIH